MNRSRMTPDELKSWRKAMHRTQEEAAALLLVSLHGYQQWEEGKRRTPGPLPLACAAISFGLRLTASIAEEA